MEDCPTADVLPPPKVKPADCPAALRFSMRSRKSPSLPVFDPNVDEEAPMSPCRRLLTRVATLSAEPLELPNVKPDEVPGADGAGAAPPLPAPNEKPELELSAVLDTCATPLPDELPVNENPAAVPVVLGGGAVAAAEAPKVNPAEGAEGAEGVLLPLSPLDVAPKVKPADCAPATLAPDDPLSPVAENDKLPVFPPAASTGAFPAADDSLANDPDAAALLFSLLPGNEKLLLAFPSPALLLDDPKVKVDAALPVFGSSLPVLAAVAPNMKPLAVVVSVGGLLLELPLAEDESVVAPKVNPLALPAVGALSLFDVLLLSTVAPADELPKVKPPELPALLSLPEVALAVSPPVKVLLAPKENPALFVALPLSLFSVVSGFSDVVAPNENPADGVLEELTEAFSAPKENPVAPESVFLSTAAAGLGPLLLPKVNPAAFEVSPVSSVAGFEDADPNEKPPDDGAASDFEVSAPNENPPVGFGFAAESDDVVETPNVKACDDDADCDDEAGAGAGAGAEDDASVLSDPGFLVSQHGHLRSSFPFVTLQPGQVHSPGFFANISPQPPCADEFKDVSGSCVAAFAFFFFRAGLFARCTSLSASFAVAASGMMKSASVS